MAIGITPLLRGEEKISYFILARCLSASIRSLQRQFLIGPQLCDGHRRARYDGAAKIALRAADTAPVRLSSDWSSAE